MEQQHSKTSLHRQCAPCDGIWSSSILRQAYTGNVHPVMEYGAAARATAAESNSSRLTKVQSKGMCIITAGLKPTPTLVMETTTRLPSLDHRLNKKVVIHSDKIRRLSAHPVSQHLEEPTKATTTKIPNKPKRNKANKQTKKKKTHPD